MKIINHGPTLLILELVILLTIEALSFQTQDNNPQADNYHDFLLNANEKKCVNGNAL